MSQIADLSRRLRASAFLQHLGPGFIVTVGFIDPGNFATNASGGSQFGYTLLWVITLSTLMLILLQHMAAHLGIQTGKCLPEAISENFRPAARWLLGVTAMLACVATALAEVLGAAIGLRILFGLPLVVGAVIAGAVVVALIWWQQYARLEHLIIGFVSIVGFCYLAEILIVKPDYGQALTGAFVPSLNSDSILIAMAMLGAVVMPHNIYLHSEVIQSRDWSAQDERQRERLLRFEFLDTLLAMGAGWLINSAMIIVAAAVFFTRHTPVSELPQIAETLRPLAGPLASLLFAIALLCSGVSSSITAGMAGGTVFSGYLGRSTELQSRWFRIGVTLTLVPAILLLTLGLDPFRALILSQAALSIQLPFTILPLYLLTRSEKVMGRFRNTWRENALLLITGAVVVILNGLLLYQTFGGKF